MQLISRETAPAGQLVTQDPINNQQIENNCLENVSNCTENVKKPKQQQGGSTMNVPMSINCGDSIWSQDSDLDSLV